VKILYVSPFPPAKDGIGTYTQVLGRALRAAGHEVAVAAVRSHADAPAEVIGALSGYGAPAALRSAVARFKPDVIHVQFAVPAFGSRTPALVRWLGELAGGPTPIVTTMHEVTRDTALLRGPGRALYRRIAAHSDHVIVHTRAGLANLTGRVGADGGRAAVIPHFSTEPPAAGTTAAELRARFGLGAARLLLAFGFIHVDKGLDDLIRAFVLCRRRAPALLRDVRVVVAGTVRERTGLFRVFEARDRLHLARVRRLARKHGVMDHLLFTGFVPDGDIAAWFDAAEAVVLPYRKAEQSGVANLAQAFGVPVIATTSGGLAELFAGSPWTVPPRSPEQLAATLLRFLGAAHEHAAGPSPAWRPQPRPEPPDRHGARAASLVEVAVATAEVYLAVRSRERGSDDG
jgi:glycosyltransferase involved in cell wall biosynthesis